MFFKQVDAVNNGLLTDLVSHYKFQGNGDDAHGTNDLVANGVAPSYVPSIIDNGANMVTGSSDFFEGGFTEIQDVISVSYWYKPTTITNDQALLRIWDIEASSGGHVPFYSQFDVDFGGVPNCILFNINGSLGENVSITSDANSISAGNWYHIFVTAEVGGDLRMYLNGVEVSASPISLASLTDFQIPLNPINLYVGKLQDGLPRYPNGIIDEVSIWNGNKIADALTVYNSGGGIAYEDYTI